MERSDCLDWFPIFFPFFSVAGLFSWSEMPTCCFTLPFSVSLCCYFYIPMCKCVQVFLFDHFRTYPNRINPTHQVMNGLLTHRWKRNSPLFPSPSHRTIASSVSHKQTK